MGLVGIRHEWGIVSKNTMMSYVSIVTTLLWCQAVSISFIMVSASWADLPGHLHSGLGEQVYT